MQFKLRPDFGTVIQYFLLPQSDGKVCLLKHVKGAYIQTLLQGNGYELHWTGMEPTRSLPGRDFNGFSSSLGCQVHRHSL
jgi:hypothetical protein